MVGVLSLVSEDHPRIRGEHCKNHSKGEAQCRIIPAYAGSTRGAAERRRHYQDHPRIRGEHRLDIPWPQAMQGSSPHTRGAREKWHIFYRHVGIIPAYAGSTPFLALMGCLSWDHPRIRGEHRAARSFRRRWRGSSPHTRGAPPPRERPARRGRIIPAYAGSTPSECTSDGPSSDHPRIRGEHDVDFWLPLPDWGSSPHTRGAPAAWRSPSASKRIIPAYAGSTWPKCSSSRTSPDHPRIRGEHHRSKRGEGEECRIIPAYAGSTRSV